MLETVQEIAIYIHRFHNLDLFQQGWYQIKITIRWEDNEIISLGTPARVVQYEASDLGSGNLYGIWRIDDADHSFSTCPFQIKYARQDIHLWLSIGKETSLDDNCFLATKLSVREIPRDIHLPVDKGLSATAAILKFELMFAPKLEDSVGLHVSLDASPAVVHEFRIPPKALLGLHSYCPVHFDALHAVLVDVSVHVSLLKASSYRSASKVPSNSGSSGVIADESYGTLNPEASWVTSEVAKNVAVIKALQTACDILLEELQKFSKAVGRRIDFSESKMNNPTLLTSILQAKQLGVDVEVSGEGKPQNGLERGNDALDLHNAEVLCSLSKNELMGCYHSFGDQSMYLWSIFLKFHRDNKTKILKFLRDAWAKDRKAEWSIWMVHSKFEMPRRHINSGSDESSRRGVHQRTASSWQLPDDTPQTAALRADLHRKSIAQMRINDRSIQDMYIFGDPLRVPIVIVERMMSTPRRTNSENSYLRHVELLESLTLRTDSTVTVDKKSAPQSNVRVLKIVVFVHGFQGHHLDLRLIRNQWLLIDPMAEVLMSEANEDKTSGDFREMGQRLAQEVIFFVKRKMDKVSKYGNLEDIRLSFVGHSIGNLIIRTAIADSMMEPFLRHLQTYVSVSGPHLGYLYSPNSVFNSGLWLLKTLKGTQCIHQLTFTDDSDIQNTFLYKLCKQKTLGHFKHIVLLSSPQDGYVPYHSARIQSCPAASNDNSKKGKAFMEMLDSCLDQIRAKPSERRAFMRFDVNFDTTAYGKNLNSFIGRAAHIDFLESDIFARFIMWSFPELFR